MTDRPPSPPPPIGMSVSATGLVLMRDFVDDCRVVFGSSLLGPVAYGPISANAGLKFNPQPYSPSISFLFMSGLEQHFVLSLPTAVGAIDMARSVHAP